MLNSDLRRILPDMPRGDLWVYGYGSLMWSPEIAHAERRSVLLHGYHRALCIYSHRHRGTPEVPGLVLGLCRGGSCWGIAFRVTRRHVRQALETLWQREMVNRVYQPRIVPVRSNGMTVPAIAFVADQTHRQFAGRLSISDTARYVAQGHGQRGPNVDYLAQTVAHMDVVGVREGHLHQVLAAVRQLSLSRSPGKA